MRSRTPDRYDRNVGFCQIEEISSETSYTEPSLGVEVFQARTEDVQVIIRGYGEVKVLDTIPIAPEVSGKILKIHPRLETGEVIHKGEILFQIDTRDYKASLEKARATVQQLENSILRIKKQYELDSERIKVLKRRKVTWKRQSRDVNQQTLVSSDALSKLQLIVV